MRNIANNIYLFWLFLAFPAVAFFLPLIASGFDAGVAAELEHGTGETSVRLMILAMMITPLRTIFGARSAIVWLQARRRSIGVAAAGYALFHLIVYFIDFEVFRGVWKHALEDAVQFSIWTGYVALAITLIMAATSNNLSQRLMKAGWKRLQRLVYLAAILVALHWVYVDGEWLSAVLHFAPLLLLQTIRIAMGVRSGQFNIGSSQVSDA